MNKFLGVLFLTAALIFTWQMIHSPTATGSETHVGIQSELRTMILNTVHSKKPDVQNLRITRLWTEAMGENKVKAVFSYAFDELSEDKTQVQSQTVDGEAILHREASEDLAIDKWALQSVKTTNDKIQFSEGSVITPNQKSEDFVDPTAPTGTQDPNINTK